MALTSKQKETIVKKLQTVSNGHCPICQKNSWTIWDEIVSANSVSLGGTTAFGGPYVPMVQIICNNCGFVAHHALGALGIIIQEE